MTMPTINFKATNTEASDELKSLVEQKLQSLEKYIQDTPSVCAVEFEKVASQQSGNIYRVEVNMQLDGSLFRAQSTMESFEKAVDEVRDQLDKELRRFAKKRETLFKKGARKIKEMLRFGR